MPWKVAWMTHISLGFERSGAGTVVVTRVLTLQYMQGSNLVMPLVSIDSSPRLFYKAYGAGTLPKGDFGGLPSATLRYHGW